MTNFCVWSRSRYRPFLYNAGAGADPIGSEPEAVPRPWASGAAQESGGSTTLLYYKYFLQ